METDIKSVKILEVTVEMFILTFLLYFVRWGLICKNVGTGGHITLMMTCQGGGVGVGGVGEELQGLSKNPVSLPHFISLSLPSFLSLYFFYSFILLNQSTNVIKLLYIVKKTYTPFSSLWVRFFNRWL